MPASIALPVRGLALAPLAAAAVIALGLPAAHADSALGADTLLGNGLVPTGQDPGLASGDSAIGTFRPGGSHTPTGLRYDNLPVHRPLRDGSDGWQYGLSVEVGLWGGSGGLANPAFRQYRDWNNGLALSWFSFEAERAADARHFSLSGSNLGRRDQFVSMEYGRYNDYSIEAFINQIPHTLGAGRTYFLGGGSDTLTLPSSLKPGANSLTAIEAAANAGDGYTFAVERHRGGLRYEHRIDERWSVYAAYTVEQRNGSRPMGGAMFFPLSLGGSLVGGTSELIEPIDQRTHDISARLQYANARTQFNLIASASIFQNDHASLTWENPFNVGSVIGANPYTANLLRGQMALTPSNQAYTLQAELSHSVPEWARARFNATVSMGRMLQNEDLLAPSVNTTGLGGLPIPGASWNYADWATTDALSQRSANARIDTSLVDLNASFVPADALTVRAKLRFSDTRNHSHYTAYNPITGQYGYLALGGAQGTVVPFEGGIYSPQSPLWHYRSIPFDGSQTNFKLDADWRLARLTTLNLSYEREDMRRRYRERKLTHDDRIKLGLTMRGLGDGTLRASYEYADRGGSAYNSDPYAEFYTTSLPGAVDPGIPHTLEELRKFDLADRRQHTLNVRVNYPVAGDVDVGAAVQLRRIDWGSEFGRIDQQRDDSVNLDANWTPSDGATAYAFLSYQRNHYAQANVNDAPGTVGAGNYGGPVYLTNNIWTADSRDRTEVLGLGFKKAFSFGVADVSATHTRSTSGLGYAYLDPGGALLGTPGAAVAALGNAFPDMSYRINAVQASFARRLSPSLSLRLLARYEEMRIADWHYTGLTPMLSANTGGLLPATYIDLGPTRYRATLFGVFLQYTM
ncbi:MAG: MtrB/PioB family decaheme-associated outer membrane protein [Proteobacteria bacterium]|nr:MtrB/PioB family decaheme-associated outer membrane protein [Pseudomonadota bacterium]